MRHRAPAFRLPAWSLAVTAMLAVQLSAASSVGLIEQVGAAGTAWLRLSAGALLFLVIVRPPLRSLRRRDVPAVLALGVTTAVMTLAFLGAIERIPLGTAVAIEFLGPLTVAAIGSRARAAIWPLLALIGVMLITEPWHGSVNLSGVGLAALAGASWAAYILLTRRVGSRFDGLQGLSMTIPVAAVAAAIVGAPSALPYITPSVLLWALALGALAPLLAFALEMGAIRRMTNTAFGTLMAAEPGIGLLLGTLVLHQIPTLPQIAGIAIVIIAGAAAQVGAPDAPARPDHPVDGDRPRPHLPASPLRRELDDDSHDRRHPPTDPELKELDHHDPLPR